jgi:Amt family ammonium transporter
MIAFFTQHLYAVGSGNANLPDGILFAGGVAALRQLGIEILGILAVMVTVFILSYLTVSLIGRGTNGITMDYKEEGMADPE